MNSKHTISSFNKVSIEATDWLLKIKSESITSESYVEFKFWLAENPENKAKFNFLNAVWDETKVFENNPVAIRNMKESRPKRPVGLMRNFFDRLSITMPALRPIVVAASVLLIIGGVWLAQIDTALKNTYRTATGEQKTVHLADGSTINLDTETIVSTILSKDSRQVELEEGRALFTVQHDPKRPFIVAVGEISVRAIGTEFNVYKEKRGKVLVAVTKGSVQISRKAKSLSSEVIKEPAPLTEKPEFKQNFIPAIREKQPLISKEVLVPGQEIIIDEQDEDYTIRHVSIKNTKSWLQGKLKFHRSPLVDLIDEINRYLDNKIIIGDQSLKDITISMNFDIKHRKNFLVALKSVLPIKSRYTADSRIIILKKN
ncbi:MAG: FecR domain-containing protein [Deltaproteobacteria bacterium]|nr:FecR domain-containing protein [Deltaproteobacteria bacterium]